MMLTYETVGLWMFMSVRISVTKNHLEQMGQSANVDTHMYAGRVSLHAIFHPHPHAFDLHFQGC